MKKYYDVVFLGGGLANGLAAYRLKQTRPEIEFLLIEAGSTYGGNHTWSFHDGDLTALEWSWVYPFVTATWNKHEVRFPAHTRILDSRYHSVTSHQFHQILDSELSYQKGLKMRPIDATPTQVMLENGFAIQASCVVDGRGWDASAPVRCGYQKFLGLTLRLKQPHHLDHPILMDATCAQTDGYRFFYVLPWDEKHVLIEDTYYSDSPDLDDERVRREIRDYAQRSGWVVSTVEREERGILPIPLEGAPKGNQSPFPLSGMRAGLFHATTGYSFPQAVRFADGFANLRTFNADRVLGWSTEVSKRHWKEQSYFRFLNRMLFRAAAPQERFRILEQFYRRSEGLIRRFYSGHLTLSDRVRMLAGRPPVPLNKAVACLWE